MWHIVLIGYLFVAVMYSAAQPSIARALIYLVFWAVLFSLEEAFCKAQQDVHALSVPPGRIVQLRLYALFMQATSGNASGSRPGFSDFEARSRWDAWQALSGLAREDAMSEYIAEAGRLKYRELLGAV